LLSGTVPEPHHTTPSRGGFYPAPGLGSALEVGKVRFPIDVR
jgi:hypothetical protein